MSEQVRELVAKAQSKDAEAFAVLIDRFERAALAVAYAVLRDPDAAGDAVQDAFLRAWTELARLHEPARFGGWLMQIVRNAALDLRRKRKPTVAEFPDLAAETDTPSAHGEIRERDAQINAALQALDETTRMAVMMRYYDGLSAKEIAELLELSPAAVDMRLSRGRSQLKENLAHVMEGSDRAAPARFPKKGEHP